MINKAIAHITKQAMDAGDELSTLMEEHLTEICTNTRVAAKLLDESKSLRQINQQIWEEARKRKNGSSACIKDAEIYRMLEVYYGITEEDGRNDMRSNTSNIIDISDLL